MNVLIKKALIVDPTSPFHLSEKDILIEKGVIRNIADLIDLSPNDTRTAIIEESGLHVSPGWMDTDARFGEPMYEQAETLHSGAQAAITGGFTSVALSSPKGCPTDTRQKVEFFTAKSAELPINIYPVGCATQAGEGKALSESYDMSLAGAIAFADDRQIQNNLIQQLVLEYNTAISKLTITTPIDRSVMHQGVVREGYISTTLGLHGIPDVAEELAVARDISIAKYTKAKLHIARVSTPEAIKLIKSAKKEGIDVTCSIAPYSLALNDELLKEFDTRYKVLPPLGTEKHIKALKKGIKEGVVCCIGSAHTPIDIEDKKCEFDRAEFGSIGLQTAFAASWGALCDTIDISTMVELLSINPRKRFDVAVPSVEIGQKAEITLFDPNPYWVFDKSHIVSLSTNSAFFGQRLKGKVFGVYCKGELTIVD